MKTHNKHRKMHACPVCKKLFTTKGRKGSRRERERERERGAGGGAGGRGVSRGLKTHDKHRKMHACPVCKKLFTTKGRREEQGGGSAGSAGEVQEEGK